MSVFFTPYTGNEPFIFVSYAHRNSETVMDVISAMRNSGLRLWYDEGIPAGSDWPKSIRDRVYAADTVLFFVSKESLDSPNCFSEIKTASSLGKRIVAVKLDDTVPAGDRAEILNGAEYTDDPSTFFDDRLKGEYPPPETAGNVRPDLIYYFTLALCALLLITAVGLSVCLFTGRLDDLLGIDEAGTEIMPENVSEKSSEIVDLGEYGDLFRQKIEIKNRTVKNAVLDALPGVGRNSDADIYGDQLTVITQLHFCGNMICHPAEGEYPDILFDGKNWKVGASDPDSGDIDDLTVFSEMPYLTVLTAVDEQIDDISPLGGLQILERLNISGNPISTLAIHGSGSGNHCFDSLRELNIEHTNIRDLTPLSDIGSLETVTVTEEMLPMVIPEGAKFEVRLVK